MTKVQDTVPVYNRIAGEDLSLDNDWIPWFTAIHRNVQHLNYLPNSCLAINPDFNWSRTKGNTPTTADGEFVEMWNVAAGGMVFSITPTYYTATEPSADTGSERYVNIAITTPNSNNFEIYQTTPNKIQKYQNKQLTFSIKVNNKSSATVKAKFKVDFDTNNDLTIDVTSESKGVIIDPGVKTISMRINTPKISTDNQNNTVYLKLVLFDIGTAVDLDLFFIKPEFATDSTPLLVEHILQKVLIDNA